MTRADSDAYMSLTRHLLELRARLLLSLAGILVGAIGAWFLYTPATTWLTRPLASAGASGINFRTIIGPFSTHITFALWAGFILTTPWWLTQLWLFIAPALTRTEKRRTALIAIPSAILFLAGVASALWFLPHAVSLLLSELPQGTSALLDFDSYISFVVILTLVIGASFLFPMIIIGIHALGLASTGQILRHWRWAVVGATVFAAITNPLPDLWSMILQMCALLALYFGAIGCAGCAIFLHDAVTVSAKLRHRLIRLLPELGSKLLVTPVHIDDAPRCLTHSFGA